MNFYQIFLPITSLFYFLLVFLLRSFIHWKQTGVNSFVFGKSDNVHDFIGKIYKLITIGLWFVIIIFSFVPSWYKFLLPIWYLEIASLKLIGLVLLLLSFLWTSIAQYQMSASWRIGINFSDKTDLVSSGLFKYSRNPVFLGVIISYFGTFLIIPNLLSFTLLSMMILSIQVQVRLEEEFLVSAHSKIYLEYKHRVKRWLSF